MQTFGDGVFLVIAFVVIFGFSIGMTHFATKETSERDAYSCHYLPSSDISIFDPKFNPEDEPYVEVKGDVCLERDD